MSYQNKARSIRKSSRSAFAAEPLEQDWDQEAFLTGLNDLVEQEDRTPARVSQFSLQTGT